MDETRRKIMDESDETRRIHFGSLEEREKKAGNSVNLTEKIHSNHHEGSGLKNFDEIGLEHFPNHLTTCVPYRRCRHERY